MGEVAKYVTVDAPVEKVYAYWRDFTNFSNFMPNVKEVSPVAGDDTLTRWKVSGPLGVNAEWDARVVEDIPNEKIAWSSLEDSRVKTSGAVRFDAKDGQTSIEVALDYDPPAGAAGELAAKLFQDPQQQVDEALEKFKQIVETW